MTKLLEDAIAEARELPEAEQDMAAEALFSAINKNAPAYRLTPEQIERVRRIQRDIAAGKTRFATDDEMAALWIKCGL